MNKINQRLFCYLDGLTPEEREHQRIESLQHLELLKPTTIPIFEQATQTAARFTETPISLLSLILPEELLIKSAVGLVHLGFLNELTITRKIPRFDSFAINVADSKDSLIIEDTYTDGFFAQSILTQYYGIRSYLGVPLLSDNNICIGVLEVMDLIPRKFGEKEIEFLNLTARWCLKEYEYSQNKLNKNIDIANNYLPENNQLCLLNIKREFSLNQGENFADNESKLYLEFKIKIELLKEIINNLKAPLTSIIGMSSVLDKQIYGKLNKKQKNYIEAINNSGENLKQLIEEISYLQIFEDHNKTLKINPVDLEMLCEQIFNTLEKRAINHKQQIQLTIEPNNRIWPLDKDKIQQAIYYLLISIINTSEPNGNLRIHVSKKFNSLNITIWNYHPWLGENVPLSESKSSLIKHILSLLETDNISSENNDIISTNLTIINLTFSELINSWNQKEPKHSDPCYREMLRLLLSCDLIEQHKGKLNLQGSEDLGYRYVIEIPPLTINN